MQLSGSSENVTNETPRSVKNTKAVGLCFINSTNRLVHVIWLDFDGNPMIYCTLAPRCGVQINTFEQHPWKVEDSLTGDRMLAGGEEIYYPIQEDLNMKIPVLITLPLLSLKDCALRKVRDNIIQGNLSNFLEMPSSLLKDLQKQLKLMKAAVDCYGSCKRYSSRSQ